MSDRVGEVFRETCSLPPACVRALASRNRGGSVAYGSKR